MALIVCGSSKQNELLKAKLGFYKKPVIDAKCPELELMGPVIVRIPEGDFYGNVTLDRVYDVARDNAGDLKIQTARLYDVEMEKFLSEPKYRKVITELSFVIAGVNSWDKDTIHEALNGFYPTQELSKAFVDQTIQMALLKTTKAPEALALLLAFNKKEVEKRFSDYLKYYKNRI